MKKLILNAEQIDISPQDIITAYDLWQKLCVSGDLDPKRFNKEFIEFYGNILPKGKEETVPFTLMFNAFIGGMDMAMTLMNEDMIAEE